MVILPAEKSFDWKHAPIMLCLIVLINTLVFFVYQAEDEAKMEMAFTEYTDADLLTNEWPAFQHYLQEQSETELLEHLQEDFTSGYNDEIIAMILMDRDFFDYLETNGDLLELDTYDYSDTWENWQKKRRRVNQTLASISALAAGLIPTELNPLSLISYQFLHGDLMHLLGNLFFLVVCGFAVEAAIGPWLFLLLYTLSGIAGGLLFALANASSNLPLVGASGAVSGVMAMYLGIFRLRKIEFFYWLFVFVGYFRAPALLILPVYIGNELLNLYLNPEGNIAYIAHAGGFITGGVLVVTMHYIKPNLINHEYVIEDQKLDPEREARANILELIDNVQLDKAISAINDYNQHFKKNFELVALKCRLEQALESTALAESLKTLITIKPSNQNELSELTKIWQENEPLHSGFESRLVIRLALNFVTAEHVALAEDIFNSLYQPGQDNGSLDVLARKLSMIYEKLNDRDKYEHYGQIADSLLRGGV